MFDYFKNQFLPSKVKREVSELYISISIKAFAVSMIAVFEPIFLYSIFNSIQKVILFYILVYLINFFILPLGAKISCKYGFEHAILFSVPAVIVYLFLLFQITNYHFLFYVAPIALAIYKSIYWTAHHADFAHYGKSSQRGSEVSVYYSLNALVKIVGPLIGGFIIAIFGFEVLFLLVSVIMFCSAIPLFTSKEIFQQSHLSYWKAIRRFFKPYANYTTRAKLAFMGYGADFVGMICWPIFIFMVVKDYKVMGILITLSLLVSCIISLIIGKAIDKKEGDKILKTSVILSFFTWIFRFFFPTIAGVFAIDFLDRNINHGLWMPVRTFVYREGQKRGFMKYIVFSEMGLSFAKVVMGLFLLILLLFINSWFIIFFTAGFFTLFFLFLPLK
ncbi:MFS transporter [Patescibacteria group bacterium]